MQLHATLRTTLVPRCLVPLYGQPEDLHALHTVRQQDWRVEHQDGTYYLTSSLLDVARDADDAYQFAKELLPLINGAAMTYLRHFEPLTLAGSAIIIKDDGTRQTAQAITGKARIRHPIAPADVQNAPQIDDWMALAYKDRQVEKALQLWGSLDHNWRNLYLVLEVIMDTTGGEKGLLVQPWLPDPTGIERFKYIANNWRALGTDARHATEKWKAPANPMILPEAQELIRLTLLAWLQQR